MMQPPRFRRLMFLQPSCRVSRDDCTLVSYGEKNENSASREFQKTEKAKQNQTRLEGSDRWQVSKG